MDWDDIPEDEFEDLVHKISGQRKDIIDPLSEEDVIDIIELWSNNLSEYVEVETELYHLGYDEDGYIIVANLTPHEHNSEQAYYFLYRHDNYRSTKQSKYKVEYISAFDDIEDVDPICQTIGFCNNIISAVDTMCIHWYSISPQ